MLIVEQGKVVDVCAEPGEYTYDMSTEPSIFSGDLGDSVKSVFQNIGKRFTFGGEAPKDQRIYYFNTKELTGNKYGTPSPVPFRVVDQRAGIDLDIGIRCFGEYSIRLKNPLLFYTNVCGNVSEDYKTENIAGQMKTELLAALLTPGTMLAAYNAQFDLLFLYAFLQKYGDARLLQDKQKLDLLTVYRDRRAYPHRLCSMTCRTA